MIDSWKKGFALITSVSALGLLLAGCGSTNGSGQGNSSSTQPAASSDSTPVKGGSIKIDLSQNVQTLDPALSEDLTSDELIQQMYDTLVTYKGSTNTIIGDVASKWDVSPDGKTYTLYLNKNVKFWNGDPVTAQNYIAEFERILTKSIGSPVQSLLDPIVEGSDAYYTGKAKSISGITAPDDYTLKIQLTKPEPYFLEILAEHSFVAIDPAWIKKVGSSKYGTSQPMGTGAFELKSFDGTTAVLTKNPNYFMKDANGNQLPYLDQVTLTYNNNTEVDAMNFEQGNTPFLAFNTRGIPSSAYTQFMSNPKLKSQVITAPAGTIWYVGLNVQQQPFTNLKVRQAVEYAINKPFIVQLLNNQFTVANQPTPPNVIGHVNDMPTDVNYSYNPEKAKELLKESGLKLPIKAKFYSSNDPTTAKIVGQIQSDLHAVGIDLQVEPMSWSSFLTMNGKGAQSSFLIDWNQDYPDASDFLNVLLNSSEMPFDNSTMYSNKQVDQWLNQAATDTNQAQRLDLYKKVTVQAMQDATLVPLYYGKYNYAIAPWVHGYYINPNLENDPLSHIWIDQSHKN